MKRIGLLVLSLVAGAAGGLDFTGIFPDSVKCVYLVSPASIYARENVIKGTNALVQAGYRVKVSEGVWLSSPAAPADRARYLEEAWLDPEADLILCVRGGSGAQETLANVDFAKLKSRDIPFLGFSNISILLNGFEKEGVKSLYSGPTLSSLVGYSSATTIQRIHDVLAGADLAPTQLDVLRAPSAPVSGKPLGGHFPSLCRLPVAQMPDATGRIMFLEVNNSYTYETAVAAFDTLQATGWLAAAAAIVLGDMTIDGTSAEKDALRAHITDAVTCPVFSGYPYGHGANSLTLDFARPLTISTSGLLTWQSNAPAPQPKSAPVSGTVVIAPGNGVATNVTDYFSGDVNLVVNQSESGGGIVTLNPSSTYTGSTTLSCGTLVANGLAGAGLPSSLGTQGPLLLGAGTFRYEGPAGATFGLAVEDALSARVANVFDIINDLTATGTWSQKTSCFVKTGPGTLTLAGAGKNFFGASSASASTSSTGISAYTLLNLQPNGDAPTQGFSGFTVADGTVRIADGTNVFSQYGAASVGARLSSDGSGEKPAVLDIAGGVNKFLSNVEVGKTGGGGAAAKPVLRISGGENTFRNIYVGPNTSMSKEFWAGFEMTGGTATTPSDCSFFLGNMDVAHITADFSGGTMSIGKNMGYGYGGGNVKKLADVVIRDSAVVTIGNRVYFQSKHTSSKFTLTLQSGGRLNTPWISQEGSVKTDVILDGGVLYWKSNGYAVFGSFRSGSDHVYVGTRGARLLGKSGATSTYPFVFEAKETVPGGTPAGVTFVQGTHELQTVMAWAGATRVESAASLYVKPGAGLLPSDTDLTVIGNVKIGATEQTIRNLDLQGPLNLYPGNPLTVTGALSGTGQINLYTAYGSGNPLVSEPGTYSLLRVPAAHAAELEAFAAKISYAVADGLATSWAVSTAGDWATLNLTLSTPVSPYDAPAGDANGGLVLTNDATPSSYTVGELWIDADYPAAVPAEGKYRTLAMDGGFLSCQEIYCSGTGSTEVNLNGGLLEVRGGHFNPGYAKTGVGATLRLNPGATLRAYGIQGVDTTHGGTLYFNGGVLQPVAYGDSQVCYVQNEKKVYVSGGGCVIDMSIFWRDYRGTYLNLKTPFLHDPALGETKDGGITVYGRGVVDFGSGIKGSTFNGPITARDGGVLSVYGGQYMVGHDYVIEPGGGLVMYDQGQTVHMDSLRLGSATATAADAPAVLMVGSNAKNISYVVSNAVEVLSPVEVRACGYADWNVPTMYVGTFTALVCRAECTIDTSKFVKPAERVDRTLSVVETMIEGGDYDGWKALVVTVGSCTPPADATWTAVSGGGDWDAAVNWGGATPPEGAGATAAFNAATLSDVPVRLGTDGRTMTGLALAGSADDRGYVFTGPLTLESSGSYAATLKVNSGTHTVESLAGQATVSVSGAGKVALGTAAFTGALTQAGTGRVEVDDIGFATSMSKLKITGKGTLAYAGGDADGVMLTVSAKPGVLEIPGTTQMDVVALSGGSSAALIKAGAGTLRFLSGTNTTTFGAVSTAGSYNDAGGLGANGAAPSAGYFGFNVADGTVEIGELNNPDQAPNISVTGGAIGIKASAKGSAARLVLNNGTFKVSDQDFYLGYYAKNTDILKADLIINGGVFSVPKLVCGYVNGGSNKHRVATTIEVNGGELVLRSGALLLGRDQRYNSTDADKALRHVFRQNGGRTTVSNGSFIAANSVRGVTAAGWVEVNGGVLDISSQYQFGGFTNDVSDLFLNGGEMLLGGDFVENRNQNNADVPTAAGPVNATLHFNGGVLRPKAGNTGVTRANNPDTKFYVEEGGAIIDTSLLGEGVYTWEPAITATNAVDGGLLKRGTGTLVLAGTNGYTGATVVQDGVLQAANDNVFDSTKYVQVMPGAVFDLGNASRAIGRVMAQGLYRNGTLVVKDAVVTTPEVDEYLTVDGNLTLASGVAIDLGLDATVDGPASGTEFPIAVVTGSVSVPAQTKARNAGAKVKAFRLTVADGVVWASPSAGGTVFIFR